MKRVLLTGASGFLGGACLQHLSRCGLLVVTTDRVGDVQHRGDLADDQFVRDLPDVDVVVHAAAVQYVSTDLPLLARHAWFERNNVQATAALCRRYGSAATRFVNVGTSMMYRQGGPEPVTTQSAMEGQGVYSASKLAAQRLVEASFPRWATVVPCIIGGPGRGGLFNGFVRSIRRFGRVIIPGRGDHATHMVHVEDVASLIALAVLRDGQGFFNAAAPRPLSIAQWAEEIAAELGAGPVRLLRLPLAPVAALAAASGWRLLAREQVLMLTWPHVLDTTESQSLGWQPLYDNARIVRDTAREIAARGTVR